MKKWLKVTLIAIGAIVGTGIIGYFVAWQVITTFITIILSIFGC